MSDLRRDFIVNRNDLSQTRVVEAPLPTLGPAEILVRIDSFSFTANNVTYAQIGDKFGYWNFFPAPEGFGFVPVWGFGDVIASNRDDVPVGERLYGYWPMSSHCVLKPEKVTAGVIIEGSAQRRSLPGAYNLYNRCASDPSYRQTDEDLQMLLRPLFMTAFLIEDFLVEHDFFGAGPILLSSASSKTALGLAFILRQAARPGNPVIGMTSPGNVGFVKGLGFYDQVVTYDAVASLPQTPVVYVDFAGDAQLRLALQSHFGDDLRHDCSVGLSHGLSSPIKPADGQTYRGAKPVLFFAPERVRKRTQDWGRDVLERRYAAQWSTFVTAARSWFRIERSIGPAMVDALYQTTLAGRMPASVGAILAL